MPPYTSINLHPCDHSVSELQNRTYDVICIGSGWAGRVAAPRLIKAGLSVLIIEDELVGGECPFWACVPSKALLRPQDALEEAKVVEGLKERVDAVKGLVPDKVFERRDTYAHQFDDGEALVPMVIKMGVALVRGTGSLVGVKKVAVQDATGARIELEARNAVLLGTGSDPIIPNIPGLAEAKPWTSRHATSSSIAPEHLLILGGGVVGCEIATAYASFGSKVTIICRESRLLAKFDSEVGDLVQESFTSRGIEIHLSTDATKAAREGVGKVTVEMSNGNSVVGTEILVAAGRRAKTSGVGLEKFGIKTDGRPVTVEESLLVKGVEGRWLYAVGDVNGRAPLTHACKYHGRVVANAILATMRGEKVEITDWAPAAATADRLALPQVIFSNPEVASVGLTRRTAKAAGKSVRFITAPVVTLGATLRTEQYEPGWAQWVAEESTNKLLGATFVGQNVAELLHASTVAVVGGLTLEQLNHAMPSFPTMSEVYLNLLEAAGF